MATYIENLTYYLERAREIYDGAKITTPAPTDRKLAVLWAHHMTHRDNLPKFKRRQRNQNADLLTAFCGLRDGNAQLNLTEEKCVFVNGDVLQFDGR